MSFPDTFRLRSDEKIIKSESASFVAKSAGLYYEDGEWAEFDTDGVTLKTNGATAPDRAVCIRRGSRYPDAVVAGLDHMRNLGWEADTKMFDDQQQYTVGLPLTCKNGKLTPAAALELVVAECEVPNTQHSLGAEWLRFRAVLYILPATP